MVTDRYRSAIQAAEELWRAGKLNEALDGYTRIVADRVRELNAAPGDARYSAADLVIIERFADLALLCGHREAADSLLDALTSIYRSAGNRYGSDYACLKRIHAALETDELRRAQELLQTLHATTGDIASIEITSSGLRHWEATISWPDTSEEERDALLALLLLQMGRILCALGQNAQSLVILERATAICQSSGADYARRLISTAYLVIAQVRIQCGELGLASDALAEADRLTSTDRIAEQIQIRQYRAKTHLLAGEYGQALALFRTIERDCSDRALRMAAAVAGLNLVQAMILLNQTAAATELLDRIRMSASALGQTEQQFIFTRVQTLSDLSLLRVHAATEAAYLAMTASTIRARDRGRGNAQVQDKRAGNADSKTGAEIGAGSDYLARFEQRALTFHRLVSERRLDEAQHWLAEMSKVLSSTDSPLMANRLRTLDALLMVLSSDGRQAAKLLRPACDYFDASGLLPDLWQARRFLIWALEGEPDSATDADRLRVENQMLDDKLARSLDGYERVLYQLNKWTDEEEQLGRQLAGIVDCRRVADTSGWWKAARLRSSIRHQLHSMLVRLDDRGEALALDRTGSDGGPSRRMETGRKALSLARRLWMHERNRVTLVFLVLPDRTLIIRIGFLRLDFAVSPVTRLELRQLASSWHTLMSRVRSPRDLGVVTDSAADYHEEECREISRAMADRLLLGETLANLPKRIESVRIVADDCLHGFPFGALLIGGRTLAERFAHSFAYSSETAPLKRQPPLNSCLIVGVSSGAPGIKPLPGAASEAKQMAAWSIGQGLETEVLVNEDAPADAVCSALQRSDLAHIACHGVFKADASDQTGLVLIPSNRETQILSLRRLGLLNLSPVRHITLASCWSADSYVRPGRWILSLPEVLNRTGAQSVLGSRWEVDDEISASLMLRFYANLSAGMPRDRALREVQMDSLAHPRTSHPAFWSGFCLYGSPDKLAFDQG